MYSRHTQYETVNRQQTTQAGRLQEDLDKFYDELEDELNSI
jgi:hypothetical protein